MNKLFETISPNANGSPTMKAFACYVSKSKSKIDIFIARPIGMTCSIYDCVSRSIMALTFMDLLLFALEEGHAICFRKHLQVRVALIAWSLTGATPGSVRDICSGGTDPCSARSTAALREGSSWVGNSSERGSTFPPPQFIEKGIALTSPLLGPDAN